MGVSFPAFSTQMWGTGLPCPHPGSCGISEDLRVFSRGSAAATPAAATLASRWLASVKVLLHARFAQPSIFGWRLVKLAWHLLLTLVVQCLAVIPKLSVETRRKYTDGAW